MLAEYSSTSPLAPPKTFRVDLLPHAIALQANNFATCALIHDGTVWCGGGPHHHAPTVVAGLEHVVRLAVGAFHACAVHADGSVRCWGESGGRSLTHPTQIADVGDAIGIAAGNFHTCILRRGGRVACWGGNSRQQAGPFDAEYDVFLGMIGSPPIRDLLRPRPVPVETYSAAYEVAAGYYATCIRGENDAPICWGQNTFGQLGNGLRQPTSPPVFAKWQKAWERPTVASWDLDHCVVSAFGECSLGVFA